MRTIIQKLSILTLLSLTISLYSRSGLVTTKKQLDAITLSLDTIPTPLDSVYGFARQGQSFIHNLQGFQVLNDTTSIDTSIYVGLPSGINMSNVVIIENN